MYPHSSRYLVKVPTIPFPPKYSRKLHELLAKSIESRKVEFSTKECKLILAISKIILEE